MNKVLVASKGIILKDNKFLMVKQKVGNQYFWDLPGGKISYGETPEETLTREIKEEVGMEIKNISLAGTWHFRRAKPDKNQVICITYLCEAISNKVDLCFDNGEEKLTEYAWVTKSEALKLKLNNKGLKDLLIKLDIKIKIKEIDELKK